MRSKNEQTLNNILKLINDPENDGMKDMFFDDVAIQGVAVKILKDIY